MRRIVPKDFRKMVRAAKKSKPVTESTEARLPIKMTATALYGRAESQNV